MDESPLAGDEIYEKELEKIIVKDNNKLGLSWAKLSQNWGSGWDWMVFKEGDLDKVTAIDKQIKLLKIDQFYENFLIRCKIISGMKIKQINEISSLWSELIALVKTHWCDKRMPLS